MTRTNNQDIVELLHPIDLGQQLVDYGVVDASAASHAATLLADGIDLVKDDDVQPTVGTQLQEISKQPSLLTDVTQTTHTHPTAQGQSINLHWRKLNKHSC